MPSYDAVVVGSGPNGLAAAIALAQAGCSVLLREAAESVGGGTRDKKAEGTLKGLVTSDNHLIEFKGKEPIWLSHPNRRSYEGILFAPRQDEIAGYYNTWLGPQAAAAHHALPRRVLR